ncbi:hypothetical protein QCA50_003386 [Cerrena zonata]|uniref:Uncharacterized protein n=1 Tax=Cerrena zonata TaxID=2478898 RepID=A0AAW0GRY0_9APHY
MTRFQKREVFPFSLKLDGEGWMTTEADHAVGRLVVFPTRPELEVMLWSLWQKPKSGSTTNNINNVACTASASDADASKLHQPACTHIYVTILNCSRVFYNFAEVQAHRLVVPTYGIGRAAHDAT